MTFKEFVDKYKIHVVECKAKELQIREPKWKQYSYVVTLGLDRNTDSGNHFIVNNYSIGEGILERWAKETNARTKHSGHNGPFTGADLSLRPNKTIAEREFLDEIYKQFRPKPHDLIQCLASDASSAQNAGSFEEFANELGYDTDSRKAEKIYLECQQTALRLQQWLGLERYAELLACEEQ